MKKQLFFTCILVSIIILMKYIRGKYLQLDISIYTRTDDEPDE